MTLRMGMMSHYHACITDFGAAKDLGIHDINLTVRLAGSTYTEVAAQTSFQSGHQHEDMVTISAKLADGTIHSKWDAVISFRGVGEGTITRFALDKRKPLNNEQEAFRDRILGKPNEAVTLSGGLAVLRVCEAPIDSTKIGQPVKLGAAGE